MKRALMTVLLCGAIVALGYGVTTVASRLRIEKLRAEASAPNGTTKVANVKVQALKPTDVEDRLLLTGGVDPWEDRIVSAEATGKIEWQGVEEGQSVKAGQELTRIDTSLMRAQFDQAQAHEKLAAQELDRARSLQTKGVATGQALDKTQADHDVASASRRLIQIRLDKSVVAAPIDGIIDKLFKDKDEFIDTGQPVARLVQTHKVKVRVGIPERDIGAFHSGDPAVVKLDALPDRQFTGSIHRIGTTAEASTLTFVTEIAIDNTEGVIKPGMIARVSLVRKTCPNSVVAPIFSILSLSNQRFVFVENGGVAHARPIEIGIVQGNLVQITKGLDPGDRVIAVGQRDLKDGDAVNVLEELQ